MMAGLGMVVKGFVKRSIVVLALFIGFGPNIIRRKSRMLLPSLKFMKY